MHTSAYISSAKIKSPVSFDDLSAFAAHLFRMDKRICVYKDTTNELYDRLSDEQRYEIGEQLNWLSAPPLIIDRDRIAIPKQLPNYLHEIGHIVEMRDQKRWTMHDLALKYYDDMRPHIIQIIAHEHRVRAIECHMAANPSKCFDERNYFGIYTRQSVCDWVEQRIPYGGFTTLKQVKDWATELMLKTYYEWSLERIEHEWKIRLEYIQNWMETK